MFNRSWMHVFVVAGGLFLAVLFAEPANAGGAAGELFYHDEHQGYYHIGDFGAIGDGKTDDTAVFRAVLQEIGEQPATLRITRGQYRVEGITFPKHVQLAFLNGGLLHIPEQVKIQILGRIDAGITHIFSGGGTVEGNVENVYIYPQWFGAVGDGIHNDATALQQAANLAATSMGRTLFIPQGDYRFKEHIYFRCNIESRGRLIKVMEIDEERTSFSYNTFVPTHHPKNNPHLFFSPDHEPVELDATYFYGIEEGQLHVPHFEDVPLADRSGTVTLQQGGTLRFYSSDFFTSRRDRKGDSYYDRNDITQLVSGRGDIFPEFAFNYYEPPTAAPWNANGSYEKGDYVTHDDGLFKATWPSGEGAEYIHPFLGSVDVEPIAPLSERPTTIFEFTYEDGSEDMLVIWRRVSTHVWYTPRDTPLTVNGLEIELQLEGHEGEVKRINAGAMNMQRSHITFNNLSITVREPEATVARLLTSNNAVNVEYNNGFFSGATYHGLGYNILNSNVANVRYNNCISTNARKGMDGRHAKNISVQGGFYMGVEDHYGRNIIVQDVMVSGLSTYIPGYATPDADLQAWGFRPRIPFMLAGTNLHIENSTIDGAHNGIFGARMDVGDLYGLIVLKNITVRRNEGDVRLFHHGIDTDFDYAHEVRVPYRVVLDDISLENSGRLHLNIGSGFDGGRYGPVYVRNTGPIGNVSSTSASTNFQNCTFEDSYFSIAPGALLNIQNSIFSGDISGLTEQQIGVFVGNVMHKNATLKVPLNFVNDSLYKTNLE